MSKRTDDVKALIQLIEESDAAITEIEISDEAGLIRVSCKSSDQPIATMMPAATIPTAPPAASTAAPQHTPPPSPSAEEKKGTPVNAPMVGTVYLAPSPDAEPFVKIGQHIKVGDTLCLIEAMKMFNKVESELSGKVLECLIQDSQPVEFDQPLFIIDTDDDGNH